MGAIGPGLLLLMEEFDRLDRAAQAVLTAQPSQMTKAAADLDHARTATRSALQSFAKDSAHAALAALDGEK